MKKMWAIMKTFFPKINPNYCRRFKDFFSKCEPNCLKYRAVTRIWENQNIQNESKMNLAACSNLPKQKSAMFMSILKMVKKHKTTLMN